MGTAFNGIQIIAGTGASQFAPKVAKFLAKPILKAEIGRFPAREVKVRFEEEVCGSDVFIIQNFINDDDVNALLMELFLLIDCAWEAEAERITAVVPYYPYSREDRGSDEVDVPISAKVVARLIRTAGAKRTLTMDLHSAQTRGFFDTRVLHLFARPVIIRRLRQRLKEFGVDPSQIVVVSSDFGAMKMARRYANALHAPLAAINKRRIDETTTEILGFVGDVQDVVQSVRGRIAVLIDDIISTAGTIVDDVDFLLKNGAKEVYLSATHGVLWGPARERLIASPVRHVFISDSIPHKDLPSKIEPVSVATLFGEAIRRIHHKESRRVLFDDAFVDRFLTERGE